MNNLHVIPSKQQHMIRINSSYSYFYNSENIVYQANQQPYNHV